MSGYTHPSREDDPVHTVRTIARVAQERRITQIVLGQTMRSRLKALFRRPLSERLQHQLRGLSIDLHLISEGLPSQAREDNAS